MEKPSSVHAGEGADDRDRHREHRDQRRPPVLQEHEDDQDHQHDGLDEGVDHLLDGDLDEARGVERDVVPQPVGEALREAFHRGLDRAGDLERVGAGLEVDADRHRRRAVQRRDGVVVLRAQLDPRHVLEPQRGAVLVRAQDDVARTRAGRRGGRCVVTE